MDRSQSITNQTGRKLDVLIVGVLVVAVGWLLVDRFVISDDASNTLTQANPEDDHTKGVFDPEIRGMTDRYVLRFRKPE